ncbi:MAG: urease accessory protein UreF [Alphaproteobacteria bacterium]|nr:urease accessory protein UreF [Alphaproteobacteria bacterium]
MELGSPLPLLVWLSPAFPVGSFAYSHGLEWAHESGDVTDFETCRDWIADLLVYGSGRNDAILLAEAWRAVHDNKNDALKAIIDLSLALQPSSERYLESTTQGRAFLSTALAAWSNDRLEKIVALHRGDITYPVAVGLVASSYSMPLSHVLEAFLTVFVSNLVSASVRLGAIGQTDGQRVIASLLPRVKDTAEFASQSSLEDLGASVFRSDLASLHHETQYTRLFRS